MSPEDRRLAIVKTCRTLPIEEAVATTVTLREQAETDDEWTELHRLRREELVIAWAKFDKQEKAKEEA